MGDLRRSAYQSALNETFEQTSGHKDGLTVLLEEISGK